ncbi:MAG: DUF4423 domain-containing protein, partial [Bdellovibrionaceae bacterium]|nr:DUF4423 domain-containing protein [Pseudobdellovibrionaceae bacterium]
EIKTTRFNLKERLKNIEQISQQQMDQYYSTWIYTAVHMALALPQLQDAGAVAKCFNIPLELSQEIILFLEDSGLVEKVKGRYEFTKMHIHLDRNSNFIQRHHINWRSQSLQSVEKNLKEDLHLSTLFAIQKSDFNKIKDLFIKTIDASNEIIRPSEPEEVYAITLDLFKVT